MIYRSIDLPYQLKIFENFEICLLLGQKWQKVSKARTKNIPKIEQRPPIDDPQTGQRPPINNLKNGQRLPMTISKLSNVNQLAISKLGYVHQ